MENKEKYEMGQRLKEEIKERFGSIQNLNRTIDEPNLGAYTSKKPREPRAGVMIKLGKAGIDMKYILLGVKENDCTVIVSELKEEIKDLKSKLYDKIK